MTSEEYQNALHAAAPDGYRVTLSVTGDVAVFTALPAKNGTTKALNTEPITRSIAELSGTKATDPQLANDISALFGAPEKPARGSAKK